MTNISALKIIQQGANEEVSQPVTMYVTAMTLRQLRPLTNSDVWSPGNPEGYQRPLVIRRVQDLAKYMTDGLGIFPTSLLLGARPENSEFIVENGFGDSDGGISSGSIKLESGLKLWIVDGQHRISGVQFAWERGESEFDDYPFPVCIMRDVDQYVEMVHFNIINTTQKKMPTDIVDRHLVQMKNIQGSEMIGRGTSGHRDYFRALTTELVDEFNKTDGPWKGQIMIPGIDGLEKGLVRHHAMVVSLEPFMKDPWANNHSSDEKLKVIQNFWNAAKQVWPEAFANPKAYRIQATVGVYSLHLLLREVVHRCAEDQNDFSVDKMRELLSGMPGVDSDFWNKDPDIGSPMTLGTGMASIRHLHQFFVNSLPDSLSSKTLQF